MLVKFILILLLVNFLLRLELELSKKIVSKKIWVRNFWVKKIVSEKCLGQKNLVGIYVVSKKCGSEFFWGNFLYDLSVFCAAVLITAD